MSTEKVKRAAERLRVGWKLSQERYAKLFGDKQPTSLSLPLCGDCGVPLKAQGVVWKCHNGHYWARSWLTDPRGKRYWLGANTNWPW